MSNARFSILQARAVKDKRISDAQFRTLAALGMYADEDGWCFPRLATLGQDLGKSKQAVGRDTIALRNLGYLEVTARFDETGGRRSNMYRLKYDLPPRQRDVDTPSTSEVDTPSTSEVDVNDPVNVPIITWSEMKKEAEQRKKEQRKNRKDPLDFFQENSEEIKEQTEMRTRVENALKRNLDWDSARSPWNGYEKKLIKREKESGQTIEGFMKWHDQDEFRKKGSIYLTPTKIEDWWLQAYPKAEEVNHAKADPDGGYRI